MCRFSLLLFLLVLSFLSGMYYPAFGNVNVGRYDAVHIVPPPGRVVVDGDLRDWDSSAEFFTYRFEEQKDKYSLRGMMMYDAENLYIAAHISDSSPMVNVINPDAEGSQPWNGDCLQVRISVDRALGWPVKDPRTASDRLAHISMWYYTPKAQPCLMMAYGMDYHGLVINPAGFQGTYIKDKDGKGYTMEYAISWKVLHAELDPPRGGDTLACIWQHIWGDAQGHKYLADLSEIRNQNDTGLAYQVASSWGKAIYEKTGNLPAGSVIALDDTAPKPNAAFFPITYTIPGKEPVRVAMHITDAQGRMVRWLLGDAVRNPGKNSELWNGQDNDGNPVPAGKYTVQWCYHTVKGKLLATANNPGNPPWNSSDNSGSWAGDYGWATGITANASHIFLSDLTGEASRTLIKIAPDGQRIWGVDPLSDLGPHTIDMCSDGEYVYILGGDFYGNPCKTGGYVKISSSTGYNEQIGETHRSYVRLTDPAANDGMGSTKNVSGIAVNDDSVFVSSEQAGQIFCIDKLTGKQISVIDMVDKPRGMACGKDGQLYVVSGTTVLRMKIDGTDRKVIATDLMDPRRIAVAVNGDFYVTVRGFYQQLFHYAADGKLLNAIGQRGGMLSPGPWIKEAMRRPLGVAIAPDGNLWVTEETMNPKRTSVWKPDGTFVAEYVGPVPYSSVVVIDPEEPDYIFSENTRFRLDYTTGKATPSEVVYDDGVVGQVGPVSTHGVGRVIHLQGRTFLIKQGGSIYEWTHNRLLLRVWFGMAKTGPGEGWAGQHMGMGIDRNEDGKIDPAETQLCMVSGGNLWTAWVADNLDVYCGDSGSIWCLPFEGFDANGVPQYNMEHCKLLLSNSATAREKHPGSIAFPNPGSPRSWMTDSDGNLYVLYAQGWGRVKRGQPFLDKGQSIIKFSPDFKVLWEYRNVVIGADDAWNTSISKPGEIIGAIQFTGVFGRFLTISSYYGQYHILDKETGLYITSLTPDTRSEPALDGMSVFTENFNGGALYVKKLQKYLYTGGDVNARVWELLGLDAVRFSTFPISFTEKDAQQALAARRVEAGIAPTEKMISGIDASVQVDGVLDEWQKADWAEFRVDDKRHGRAAIAWHGNTLYAAFDITDDSPMRNRGGNPNLIFRSGDAVELDLSSANPDIKRADATPLLGDKRILVSFVKDANGNDQPLVMLYEPKSNRDNRTPGTFTSPVSTITFDHVGQLSPAARIQRREGGYIIEFQLDAALLGFSKLEVGQRIRADFGALFSDQGGSMVLAKTLWADDSPEVNITNDIPSEAKIRPLRWGWIVLR